MGAQLGSRAVHSLNSLAGAQSSFRITANRNPVRVAAKHRRPSSAKSPFDSDRRTTPVRPILNRGLKVSWIVLILVLANAAGALEWEQLGSVRRAKLPVPKSGKTGFTSLPSELTGIAFTNSLPAERAMTNMNLLNGS